MEIEANKSYINRRLEVVCCYTHNEPSLLLNSYAYMKKVRNIGDNTKESYEIFKHSGKSTLDKILNIHSSLASHMSTNERKNDFIIDLYINSSAMSDTFDLILRDKLLSKDEYIVSRKLGESPSVIKISNKRYEILEYYTEKIYGALISIKPTVKIQNIQDKFKNLSKSIEKR